MDKDRRAFLKQAGWTIIGGSLYIAVFPLSPPSARASQRAHLYAFVVDTTACIGCGKCVQACEAENSVPDHAYRTWVERYSMYKNDKVVVDSPEGGKNGFPAVENRDQVEKSFFVPKLCNHCEKPNCVQVCPVGATYVSDEGVVLVDDNQCVGCGYCIQACPYGARFLNPRTKVADKCTWCYHRITKGLDPACVTVCPTGARKFGRIDDPASPVYSIIKESRIQVLKPETGNEPMAFYVGLDKEVR